MTWLDKSDRFIPNHGKHHVKARQSQEFHCLSNALLAPENLTIRVVSQTPRVSIIAVSYNASKRVLNVLHFNL